jgi:YHS domain-containing protein
MLSWLLRLVLLVLAFQAIRLLVRGMAQGYGRVGAGARRAVRQQWMSRDPVCGVFVVRSKAITAPGASGIKYFCSEECRRRYLASDELRRSAP